MEELHYSYNGTKIDFLPIENDSLMINATQMAKIFGKEVKHFNENDSTEKFINACLISRNSDLLNFKKREDLIISKQNSGTWMHRILALKFAAWLDPMFEVWVYTTIDKIIFGNYREIKEATVEKLRAEKLQQLKKQELIEKYPDLSEYFVLEDKVSTADRKRMKAVKASVSQLRMDLFTKIHINNS